MKTSRRSSTWASKWRKGIYVTLNVLVRGRQATGIFTTSRPTPGFTENGPKWREYTVGGQLLGKKKILFDVRGQRSERLETMRNQMATQAATANSHVTRGCASSLIRFLELPTVKILSWPVFDSGTLHPVYYWLVAFQCSQWQTLFNINLFTITGCIACIEWTMNQGHLLFSALFIKLLCKSIPPELYWLLPKITFN